MNIIALMTWGAALGSALIAGVFFAFSTFVMAALARLPPAQGIAAMQAINVTVLNPWFLGVFVGTAIACLVLAVTSLMHWGEPGSVACLAGSLLYLAGSFAVTRVFNIPRNDALDEILPESAGAAEFWARYLAEWLPYNHVRTVASLAAAASFILALVRVRPPPSLFVATLLAALGMNGCAFDALHPLPPPGSLEPPAERLSQLGLFEAPLAEQRPRAGLVPYDVNASLDADGAVKRRYIWLPRGARLRATADRWDIPTGTYLVKTFSFPIDVRRPALGERLIETRFLVKTSDGFVESTYLWNGQQTDAVVSRGNIDVPVSWIDQTGQSRHQNYHVPGTSQCASCHEDRALGIRSRQLDHPGVYPGGARDQITHFAALGIIGEPPPPHVVLSDPAGHASLELRARSYLDAHCGHCHGPGGSAERTRVLWDLEHTSGTELPSCRTTHSVEGRDHVLVPGHPEASEFLARMRSSDLDVRMPRGPSRIDDEAGIALLSSWVLAMKPARCE